MLFDITPDRVRPVPPKELAKFKEAMQRRVIEPLKKRLIGRAAKENEVRRRVVR